MSILDSPAAALTILTDDPFFDEGQVAAAAYLARYSSRTLDAYRHDLRCFFQWASDVDLAVLKAKRPHIELYRTSMEQRACSVDDRSQVVDGLWVLPLRPHRWAASAIQPSTSVDPRSTPRRAEGSIAKNSGHFSTPLSDSIRTMPLRRAARTQRPPGERGVWNEHRGLRRRPGAPDPEDHGQGQQAGGHSPRAESSPDS